MMVFRKADCETTRADLFDLFGTTPDEAIGRTPMNVMLGYALAYTRRMRLTDDPQTPTFAPLYKPLAARQARTCIIYSSTCWVKAPGTLTHLAR